MRVWRVCGPSVEVREAAFYKLIGSQRPCEELTSLLTGYWAVLFPCAMCWTCRASVQDNGVIEVAKAEGREDEVERWLKIDE